MRPNIKLLTLSLASTLFSGCLNLNWQELCSSPDADPANCYGPPRDGGTLASDAGGGTGGASGTGAPGGSGDDAGSAGHTPTLPDGGSADSGNPGNVAMSADARGDLAPIPDRPNDVGPDLSPLEPPIQWERVSVSSNGTEANGANSQIALSGNGRYLAFLSEASNLVPGDTNALADHFRYDRQTKSVVNVNVSTNGAQANRAAEGAPSISTDGRYLVFVSPATNLVPSDTNNQEDVFVRDIEAGTTTRVSTSAAGTELMNQSPTGAIAALGRYVVFSSRGDSEVVPGAPSKVSEAYRKDLQTGAVLKLTNGEFSVFNLWVSPHGDVVAILGSEAGKTAGVFFIHDVSTRSTRRLADLGADVGSDVTGSFSNDGRFFAFDSWANPNTGQKTNHAVYLLDRQTWKVRPVSETATSNGDASGAFISADGGRIAFSQVSQSSRLEPRIFRPATESTTAFGVGNDQIWVRGLSDDGTTIAVLSKASDLSGADTNGLDDVFVNLTPIP
jgi:Tol biopolymer transport system component